MKKNNPGKIEVLPVFKEKKNNFYLFSRMEEKKGLSDFMDEKKIILEKRFYLFLRKKNIEKLSWKKHVLPIFIDEKKIT